MVEWMLVGAVREQLGAVLHGFSQVVPPEAFSAFSAEEAELLVNGIAVIDVAQLRATTAYSAGLSEDHPTIGFFWEALHGFSNAQRQQVCAPARRQRIPSPTAAPRSFRRRHASACSPRPTCHVPVCNRRCWSLPRAAASSHSTASTRRSR